MYQQALRSSSPVECVLADHQQASGPQKLGDPVKAAHAHDPVVSRHRHPQCADAPPTNLVQIGIGGWIGNRPGIKVAQERDTTVITVSDVEELGIERAMDIALECAWKDADAVFLSFDIDCIDPGFAPGTGTPEPGGLLPREALKGLRMVAREGICGMEVVEIAPEYDHSDVTAQLGARAIMDVLGTMVEAGHLGDRPVSREQREQLEHERRERWRTKVDDDIA